jgi:hypothetical protein
MRAKSQSIFNGSLVRQDTDLTAELLSTGDTVNLSRTDYFSMICSNYLTGWRVLDRRTGSELVDGAELFLRDDRMIPLAVQRELVEESNIHYRDIDWTEVVGYFAG